MRRPLAVNVMPLERSREAILRLASRAEDLGFDALLLPETWSYDCVALLAEIASRTRRIALGTSILSVWGRSAATLAMAATTLQAISGGRFILGLGASSPQLTEGLHDQRFAAPATKLRRTVERVRALLGGGAPEPSAVPEARALKLSLQSEEPVPIYAAALSPQAIAATAELCDGWLPFLLPRDHLRRGIGTLREGARRVSPGRAVPRVCPMIPAVVADDRKQARAGAAWFVAFYLMRMGDIYRRILEQSGFAGEVGAVLAANRERFTGAVPDEAERLLEQLTVFGEGDEIPAQLERWYAAGADLPVLVLQPGLDAGQLERTLAAARA